ncbi:uncharacterized protein LACBIDRAFT_296344 [Laccaria bicolor S238N-H82]|uniref:Predicted protein n=1 Tax=Laccaria bicolor (strain S238N-H82 / ATCC MYA-4686) TaxID=486041 RepID=B0D8J7_LACBS|nr:uncharacterized protein LACBIDRAFT_296344 [Laccaria bicolor S238N-H82]EDR09085.1 predicted protein [Laccaria bicolor S238N-H82]|eukprot:XP_001880398.1 predicted protein [Laccaria bicolor S238N-H82]
MSFLPKALITTSGQLKRNVIDTAHETQPKRFQYVSQAKSFVTFFQYRPYLVWMRAFCLINIRPVWIRLRCCVIVQCQGRYAVKMRSVASVRNGLEDNS